TLKASNSKEMNHYSTDLTDNQWQVIEKFLDVQVRKRKYSLRSITLEGWLSTMSFMRKLQWP
ncbi:MAG: hypothetical protein UH963_02115, partial [Agathobacter sp.]|nr:hypothetical protein [Agathobacter sp.]